MRERRKEPRKGSEIDPEIACIQTVGAPASSAFETRVLLTHASAAKDPSDQADPEEGSRTDEAGVTAYLLYNGSATYVYQRA